MKTLREECSAKMETLLKLQRELGSKEYYQLTRECVALENRAETLQKKGLVSALKEGLVN